MLVAVALGLAAPWLATPLHLTGPIRAVVGWDVGALTLTVLCWNIILRATPEQTRARARTEDPGRTLLWLIALASSLFSLFAAMSVLRHARGIGDYRGDVGSVLAVAGIVLSWVLTHTVYALRYARLYYRGSGAGGLEFPGKGAPCDLDFAYFAFTLGMCFQTSDVAVSTTDMRRTVLAQSLLAFVYNTSILALSLNLVFSLLGG